MGRFTDYLGLAQPRTGRLIAEDGTTVNQADMLKMQGSAAQAAVERRQGEFSNRSIMGYAYSGSELYSVPSGDTADFMIGGNAPYDIQVHSVAVTMGGGSANITLHHANGYSVGNTGRNLYNGSESAPVESQALTSRKEGGAVDSAQDLLATFHEAPTGGARRLTSLITVSDGIITVKAGSSLMVKVENTGTDELRCAFSALWVEPHDNGLDG